MPNVVSAEVTLSAATLFYVSLLEIGKRTNRSIEVLAPSAPPRRRGAPAAATRSAS